MAAASMRMEVRLEAGALREMYARMAHFGAGAVDRMDESIGAAMVASTQRRFRAQRSPLGNPWKPSRRALKEHGQTLVKRGLLLGSLTFNVIPGKGVEWGSPMKYAGVHQTGADITVYPRSQQIFRTIRGNTLLPRFVKKSKANFASWATISKAYTIHIPARPYLGIDQQDAQEISEIAVRHEAAAILGTTGGSR
jgi:phage virion morphogenesis protein